MEEPTQQIENQDPEEVNILRAINRGEKRWDEPDWQSYLSSIVKMIGLMNPPISYIGCAWALLNEIDNYHIRNLILGKWQDLAPKCFPTQEAADDFIADMDCLVRTNIDLKALIVMHGAKMPHTYDNVDGGKGLNELALVWADEYVSATGMVSLASEIHNTVSAGEKDPMIEYFLYSSRNRDQLPFDNIYDFSRNLFLAESFRQYLTTGKMYTSAPLGFADIKRKLRNACFEEYIRLRIAQIEAEMEDDNLLLLDPTTEDYYQELYKQERSVVDREEMFESFRGSQAYHDRWYRGRPEVLQMIQYFMEYLNWKMQKLNNDTMQKPNQTIHIDGDYVAGNKYTGDVFGNIEAGGVGKQVFYGAQRPQRPAAAPTNAEKRESASFEPVTATFTKNRTQTYNIVALYQDLLKEGWIEEGNPDDFSALFEGKPTDCRIVWTKKVGKDNLYALFKMMVDNSFITVPSGYGLQRIVESHFVYKNGEYVTGIDSGKPSESARTLITSWCKLLGTKVNLDD